MTEPTVDIIIPVHRTDRPVEDAVASATSAAQGLPTRINVVLHDLVLPDDLHARLASRVRIHRCDDGIRSPSGPRNLGLDAATAPFVFFLDSDDRLAPGCLRRLHEVALETSADVVLPSIRAGHRYLGTPLAASRARRTLDVVGDHLFLRSHSFALLRRSTLEEHGIRYPDGVPTGQDLVFMSRLYVTGRTAMALDAVYVLDEGDWSRVSTAPRPPRDQVAAVRHLLEAGWVADLPPQRRDALMQRILSVNLAGGWRRRTALGQDVSAADHARMRDLALAHSPRAARLLSVRDRVTLRFTARPGRAERLLLSRPLGLVPCSPAGLVSRRGPLVGGARQWMVQHRRRRSD